MNTPCVLMKEPSGRSRYGMMILLSGPTDRGGTIENRSQSATMRSISLRVLIQCVWAFESGMRGVPFDGVPDEGARRIRRIVEAECAGPVTAPCRPRGCSSSLGWKRGRYDWTDKS